MKLTCLQENLSRGLSIVGRAVQMRPSIPILNGIRLSTDSGQLKLTATDLELSIIHWVGARLEKEGALVVPARPFTDLVNALPPGQLSLSVDPESLTLALDNGALRANFRGSSVDEFPVVPMLETESSLAIDAEALRLGLHHVTFAAATDERHPVLTGVLAEFEGKTLTLVAADGIRLAMRTLPLRYPVATRFSVIIPARAMAELARILHTQTVPVQIATTRPHNQILFQLQNTVLNSQLIDGYFPDFRRLILKTYNTRVVLEREALLTTFKQVAIFARNASHLVRLTFVDDALIVSANASQTGEGTKRLSAHVEGNLIEVNFNVRFLIDVLSALDVPQVALELDSPTGAALVKAVGDSAFTYLLMPVRP